MAKLYPYQKELVGNVVQAFNRHKSVCLQAPTGSGKTVLAGDLTSKMLPNLQLSNGNIKHCLFLVHRRELLHQTTKTLRDFGLGEHIGHISPNHAITKWMPIQIGMIQTVFQRLKAGKLGWLDARVLVIDEAHHIRAATWEKVIESFPGTYNLGLTATPARLDGKGLGKIYEHLILGPSPRDLIAGEYLCELEFAAVGRSIDLKSLHKRGGDYARGELAERMNVRVMAETKRNWERLASDRRTLNFAITREKSEEFVEGIRAMGYTAEHVDHKMAWKDRDAAFRRFEQGLTQVLSNVNLASEGVDVPECDCVILPPTESLVRFLQMVGRVWRKKADGRKGLVLDGGHNLMPNKHGDPREPYQWSLAGGVEMRDDEGRKRSNMRECRNCGYYFPIRDRECPVCGKAVESGVVVGEVDVQMEMLSEEEMESRRRKMKKKRERKLPGNQLNAKILDTGGDFAKLKALQVEYGYDARAPYMWWKKFQPYWKALNRV